MAIRLPIFLSEVIAGRNLFPIITTSHLVRGLLTEDAGGLDQQNDDQKDKGKRIREFRQPQSLDDILTNSDDKRADDRTGNRTDSAEHRCHESLQTGHGTGGGNDRVIVGEVEQRADSSQEAADHKGHTDHVVDLNAHELTGLKVPGDRPHGHSRLGPLDHQHQQQHQNNGQNWCDDSNHLGGGGTDLNLFRQERNGGINLRQAACEIQGAVLQQIGYADGGDHYRHSGR